MEAEEPFYVTEKGTFAGSFTEQLQRLYTVSGSEVEALREQEWLMCYQSFCCTKLFSSFYRYVNRDKRRRGIRGGQYTELVHFSGTDTAGMWLKTCSCCVQADPDCQEFESVNRFELNSLTFVQ